MVILFFNLDDEIPFVYLISNTFPPQLFICFKRSDL